MPYGLPDPIIFSQVNAPLISVQATEDGDLLVFKNAILARAEVNKNNDEITPAGIAELAATIGGRPIDVEHNPAMNCGFFTAGRSVEGGTALSVDGIMWPERYPDEANGVKVGTHGLSIEANADSAECSVCGQQFAGASDYCEHLQARRTYGAKRKLAGLKSKGGGVTKRPAGTDTRFDPAQIYMVASHAEVEASWFSPEKEGDLDDGDFAWLSNAYKQGKAPKSEGRKLPYKKHGRVDPVGWKAAWQRAHQEDTDFSGGPSREAVLSKLKSDKPEGVKTEANMKCPKCGTEIEATVDPGMAAKEEELAAAKKLVDEAAEKAKSLEAKASEAEAKVADVTAKLAEVEKAKAEAEQKAAKAEADLLATTRRAKLPGMDDKVWTEKKESIVAMDGGVFDLFASAFAAKPAAGQGAGLRLDASAQEDSKTLEPLTL